MREIYGLDAGDLSFSCQYVAPIMSLKLNKALPADPAREGMPSLWLITNLTDIALVAKNNLSLIRSRMKLQN